MTREWKDFQDLVGRIEKIASQHDAVVRSPDRIRDIMTGASREVDASIRQRIGSADLLITIECRRHASVQDVTWIEQLATKRTSIGAALTIAVSASGFSQGANDLAKRSGIATRVVRELLDDEIRGMLTRVDHVTPHIEIVAMEITLGTSQRVLVL